MASGLRIIPDSLRSRASSTMTASYQTLGSALSYPVCLIKCINNSNQDVLISWDGVNDHDIVPAGSFFLYDVCSDAGAQRGLYVGKGTQFWVKGTAGTGTVYLANFYTSEY